VKNITLSDSSTVAIAIERANVGLCYSWLYVRYGWTGAPFYNGAGALTTHKGRPRKRCKIALPECSPPSDSDPFAAPNFSKRSSPKTSWFINLNCFLYSLYNEGIQCTGNGDVLKRNTDPSDLSFSKSLAYVGLFVEQPVLEQIVL